MKTINSNSDIAIHFDIRLKDGSIADSTRNIGKPFRFKLGTGIFADKLEEKLIGLKVGDKSKIMLLPEDAFGEPHPAQIYQVPKAKFAQAEGSETLEVGSIFMFTQPNGQEIPGIVQAIDEHEITVDFNHPLAGQVILFDIEVIDIK
jgi:FKBP-type peptidyl-prolyl cis-trans isomerase SlpA